MQLWDVATGKQLRQIEMTADANTKEAKRSLKFPWLVHLELHHFQFSPDTKTLATAGYDGILRLWDVATGKERNRWDTSDWIDAFAFSPDGKTVALVSASNVLRLWDTVTGTEMHAHPSHRHGCNGLALSPDGHLLASVGNLDQAACLWDTATGRQLRALTAADETVHSVRFSTDGRTLTTLGDDDKARVWDVAAGEELRQLPIPVKRSSGLHVLSPDGKTWASEARTKRGAADLVLWDAATGKEQRSLAEADWWIGALAFSPDSRTLYSWGGARKVRSWDVTTGKKLREFAAGDNQHRGSFSPDGNWFACGGEDQVLLLYDLTTGSAVRRLEFPGRRDPHPAFAYSPDSRTLAIGAEGPIHLLELASGKFRRHLTEGHQGGISALLFSSDGNRLISGSSDTTALVWDLTGRLHGPPRPLRAADLDACWTDLAGADAEAAYRAIHRLAASPTEALPYLEKRLQPPARPEAGRLARLIRDLDSDHFAVRERAFQELEELGERATVACRQALAGKPSPEERRRLEMLVEKQEQPRWRWHRSGCGCCVRSRRWSLPAHRKHGNCCGNWPTATRSFS